MARISVFELMERSSKNMGAVNSRVKDYALELIKRSYIEGINVLITSGFRSYEEQNKLYAQGRTTAGNRVTNARAGQSIHNFGYAIDYALTNEDGSKIIWVVNSDWKRVAQIGKSLGFSWGGDWSSFVDYPHLDFQKGMPLSQFRAGKRPTIRPLPARDYIAIGDTGNEVISFQKDMNKLKYNLKVDGVFGDGSETALKHFQGLHGLKKDGIYGKGSKSKVQEVIKLSEKKTEVKPVAKPAVKPKWQIDYENDLKGAIEMGFIDGTRLDENCTREELGVVAYRVYKAKK